jgi:hypothetical protein
MEPWAIAILSGLSGALFTAFGYTFLFTSKLTRLQTLVEILIDKQDEVPQEIMNKITQVCTMTDNLKERVKRLEEAR